MKKLASLLLALSLIFGLVSFSYAEEPYEVVIETVTFGAEYADIPAIEEAINAITVPAINVSVKILNVGIPEHAQKISMMIAGGEKIDLVMAGLTMPMVNMAVDGMLLPLDEPQQPALRPVQRSLGAGGHLDDHSPAPAKRKRRPLYFYLRNDLGRRL